jgi:hypothetical protein
MASIHGKNSLSFRRTKSSTSDSSTVINQDYKFAHESVAGGETFIDIDALVTPTSINTGITNPMGGQLAGINLKNNSNSIVIISSANGTLQQGSWQVSSSGRRINLAYTTEPNEVFTVQIRTSQATANVVDADAFAITGTLLAGDTDIPLGQVFTLNANEAEQIGEIVLSIDGVEQLRNVNNATANPLADGNYEEVDAGNNQTNLLRLNESYPLDVAYSVKANGLIVNAQPNNSFTQQLESLGGQIDQMIPTLADLAGVDETDFQSSPNNVDLKAFADKVYQNSADIAANAAKFSDTTTIEVPIVTPWQDFTPQTANFGTGGFSTLTGKWRRVGEQLQMKVTAIGSANGSGGSVLKFLYPNSLIATNLKGDAGYGREYNVGGTTNTWAVFDVTANTDGVIFQENNTPGAYVGTDWQSNSQLYFTAEVQIDGWDAAQTITILNNL